jgi:hypothetical protein
MPLVQSLHTDRLEWLCSGWLDTRAFLLHDDKHMLIPQVESVSLSSSEKLEVLKFIHKPLPL